VLALAPLDEEFFGGTIHAVLGENGAGKSTLMNLLAGILPPDSGEILVRGTPCRLQSPRDALGQGIGMVHQHFMLVPAFSVRENLALAQTPDRRGGLDEAKLIQSAVDVAAELGWEVPLDARTEDQPVGVRQRIEILKVLASDPEIIILDEPTAVLAPDEVDDLFRVLRQLKARGKLVLLIAHKLSEIVAIADRVTVLRRGVHIATANMAETTAEEIATWMVGELPPQLAGKGGVGSGSVVLRASGLRARGDRGEESVRGVDLEISGGEIVGLGGVDGNGQVELAETLCRVRPLVAGQIESGGTVAYVPQDRQVDGLALGMSIEENFLIGGLSNRDLVRLGVVRPRSVKAWARRLVETFRIKIGRLQDPARSLSGGNQQKIVVSRALDQSPAVLVAVNPTRGLDFAATEFVHSRIVEAAERGCGVALFSTDLDELRQLSDRILFMSRGQLVEGESAQSLLGGPA